MNASTIRTEYVQIIVLRIWNCEHARNQRDRVYVINWSGVVNSYVRMVTRFLNVILVLVLLTINAHAYELGVCSLFRDDAEYIPEWIDFHRDHGVEHFWLYNNLSADDYQNILRKYVDDGVVTIVDWPVESSTPDTWPQDVQNTAFEHCIANNKNTHWIAFIDTDEFLFCVDGSDLRVFLRGYDQYQCLCVDWLLYGTNHIYKTHGDLIRKLLYRAPDDYAIATKCVAKPKHVQRVHYTHYFIMDDINKCVDENFRVVDPWNTLFKRQTISKIRINHYFCRDLFFLYNVKIPRTQKLGRKPFKLLEQENAANSVYDDSILKVIK